MAQLSQSFAPLPPPCDRWDNKFGSTQGAAILGKFLDR
jgi:hypothetical protein